jgi:hypothetical protein
MIGPASVHNAPDFLRYEIALSWVHGALDNRTPVWYPSTCTHKYIGRGGRPGATECEVRLLDIPDGAPVTYAERITCTADGVASEYLVAVWCSDRHEPSISLTHPQ